MGRCRMPEQHFIAMACDSKLHIQICHVISVKLNIGKKITGLEIVKWNRKKNLACFQTYRTDV